MPIQLLILSGARRGEQLEFAKESVSIGDERASDVYFSAWKHPGVKGRRAQLVLDEAGWRIQNQGEGDWYLNQSIVPMYGASPLRSGDIVRLSELGPDFRFSVVPEPKPPVSKRPAARPAAEAKNRPSDSEETSASPGDGQRTSRAAGWWPAAILGAVALLVILGSFLALRQGETALPPSPVLLPQDEASPGQSPQNELSAVPVGEARE